MKFLAIGVACLVVVFLVAGCSTTSPIERKNPSRNDSGDGFPSKGFDVSEVKDFIEFCVDLNSQDDRLAPGYSPIFDPKPTPDWRVTADSRKRVMEAIVSGKIKSGKHRDKDDEDCQVPTTDAVGLEKDPRCNGFGPFQNAWVLYQNQKQPNTYALAIRGTVVSSKPTVIEDMLASTVSAVDGIKIGGTPVRFASLSSAEVHAGFAYATFSTLFDKDFGAFKELEKLPEGSKLYIVGHSQGAAMATLTHAMLHYGMEDSLGNKLHAGRYKLKSYGFAQAKPGNADFANEFMAITYKYGNGVAINNDLDPIPKVPFSFESGSDWVYGISGKGFWISAIHSAAGAGKSIRSWFSSAVEKNIDEYVKTENFYLFDGKKLETKRSGSSLNYASAGMVVPLHGEIVEKKGDEFYQHHATTYRGLLFP